MSKGESGLEIMWFHLECFLFFQSTSLKTINHSVSQPNCSLWKVSMQQAWRAESPPRLVELGRLVQLRTHLASPETWWCFKRSWSCLYPCHEWAVPQHHRCDHTVSVCGGSVRSQAGCCFGADAEFLLSAFTQLRAESWWWYYEEEEPSHLLCKSPSSPVCIADILMHQWRVHRVTSWYLECLQLLTRAAWSHMFWMVEFPVDA